jgi:hypothetical protein
VTWVRFDDQTLKHPKVRDLSRDAKFLFIAGSMVSAEHLTDGVLSPALIRQALAHTETDQAAIAELAAAELWHEDTEWPGWYIIHDYLDYNPSKADIEARKEATAERQRRWREQQRELARVEIADAERNGVSNALRNGVSNEPNPVPLNPVTPVPLDPKAPTPRRARAREADAAAPPRERLRDALWDAGVEVFGEPANQDERGKRNRALKLLRQAGAEADELRRRHRHMTLMWPDITPTDMGLARNWTTIGMDLGRRNGSANGTHRQRDETIANELDAALGEARAGPGTRRGGPAG